MLMVIEHRNSRLSTIKGNMVMNVFCHTLNPSDWTGGQKALEREVNKMG
jgi:hypothetical protein